MQLLDAVDLALQLDRDLHIEVAVIGKDEDLGAVMVHNEVVVPGRVLPEYRWPQTSHRARAVEHLDQLLDDARSLYTVSWDPRFAEEPKMDQRDPRRPGTTRPDRPSRCVAVEPASGPVARRVSQSRPLRSARLAGVGPLRASNRSPILPRSQLSAGAPTASSSHNRSRDEKNAHIVLPP